MDISLEFFGELSLIIISAISIAMNFISSREMSKANSRLKILETQFLSLHSKRSETIGTLYKKLVKLQLAMSDYAAVGRIYYHGQNIEAIEKQRANETIECFNDYQDFLSGTRLYFSKDLVERLSKIAYEYKMNLYDFHAFMREKNYGNDDIGDLVAARKKEEEGREAILNAIPKLVEAVEIEFKKILGVEETK